MSLEFSKFFFSATLSLFLLSSPFIASAQTGSISQLKQDQLNITDQTAQVKQDLQTNQDKINALTGQISQAQISLGQTKDKISALNQKMSVTEKRINKRTDILKQEVKATYVSGSRTNLLTLLLDANNFGDFISRAYAVYKITNHQQDLINQQLADKKTLEQTQQQLKLESEKNQETISDLKTYISDLQTTVQKEQRQVASLQNNRMTINSQIMAAASQISPPLGSVTASNSSSSASSSDATNSAIPSIAASGNVSDLIQKAEKFVGHSSYVFGGGRTAYDIQHGYFDCSGFVHWAYEQIGINLSGWSTSSLQYVGTPVSPKDMKPGDLIFFNTYEPNGHVDIYIGNGAFIGSQSSTGVSIENIHSSYWASHFSGTVRRVLN